MTILKEILCARYNVFHAHCIRSCKNYSAPVYWVEDEKGGICSYNSQKISSEHDSGHR
jgi:hypothetical protein